MSAKPAREERRGQFDDMMLRLEPGDEVRFLLAADFAEADKGVHLVLVAAHGLGHRGDLGHVGIGRDIEQIVVLPQPPQQAVEQGEPLGVAVQDRDLRQFDEFGRYVEGAVWRLQRRRRRLEQFGRVAATLHVTSDGFTSFSASARAALRQPSKSVSLSRVMWCMLSLTPRHCEERSDEAIHVSARGSMDCFVASLLAMTLWV